MINIDDIRSAVEHKNLMFMMSPSLSSFKKDTITLATGRIMSDLIADIELARYDDMLEVTNNNLMENIEYEEETIQTLAKSMRISEQKVQDTIAFFEVSVFEVMVDMAKDTSIKLKNPAVAKLRALYELGYSIKDRRYHQTSVGAKQSILRDGFDVNLRTHSSTDRIMPNGVFLKPTREKLKMGETGAQMMVFQKAGLKKLNVDSRKDLVEFLSKINKDIYRRINSISDYNIRMSDEVDDDIKRLESPSSMIEESRIIKEKIKTWGEYMVKASGECREMISSAFDDIGIDALEIKEDVGQTGSVKTTIVRDPSNLAFALMPIEQLEYLSRLEVELELPF